MVIDKALVSIISRLARDRGENMLATLTLALSEIIGAEHVFVARLNKSEKTSTTECYVHNNQLADNFSYELKHTPCAQVSDDRVCCFNGDVQEQFPLDQLLIDMGVSSYIGTPMYDSNGKLFGIIVALFEGLIPNTETTTTLFTLFSGLIAGDIERSEKQQALNITEAILQEMDEAVVLANEDYEIVSCNRAFTELTGYTAEEAIGKNPNLLKSGVQDNNFYEKFWKEINDTGEWEGEIYNRKKSGELYPEYMRIRRVYEPVSGKTYYLVIHQDISALNQAREEAYFNKNFDGLTHLPNRQLFLDRLNQQLILNEREFKKSAIVCLDLDGYQGINTTLGHEVANQLLILLSRRLKNKYRSSDILGHLGSDEFAICLNDINDSLDAQQMVTSLLATIKEPFNLHPEPITVSATIGLALYPEDATVAHELLAKADQAMVHAKSMGKDRYEFFTQSIQTNINNRLQLKRRLKEAVDNRELVAAFQPIINSKTGHVVKLEALVRWPNDEGMISPAEFIPVAEEFGFCHDLGNQVLQQSCQLMEEINRRGFDLSISVNRSIAEFKELNHDVSSWLEIIENSPIQNDQISFEITESLLASEQDSLRESLYRLKDAGCQILMDDFGTGYSSLSYLRSFPIDYLKIDRSFIMDLGSSHESRSLVASIIAMSKALGIKTIAEGIESKRQLAILGSLDCGFYQGFYFSKPMFADELLQFLDNYSPDPSIFA